MWRNKKRLAMTAAGAVVSLTVVSAAIFGGQHYVARAQRSARSPRSHRRRIFPAIHRPSARRRLAHRPRIPGRAGRVHRRGHLQRTFIYRRACRTCRIRQRISLIARYRAGTELPPAPITALAVGLAGDSHAPELWIATAGEGLVAFDGRAFRQIRAEDAEAYGRSRRCSPLDTGRILIGTEKAGVLVYDGRELKPFHPSLADIPVTALAGDEASLWIGTIDRGLLHWKAGALETIADALPDKQMLSLAIDSAEDSVYAGTGLGVAEIRDGKVTRALAPGIFRAEPARG